MASQRHCNWQLGGDSIQRAAASLHTLKEQITLFDLDSSSVAVVVGIDAVNGILIIWRRTMERAAVGSTAERLTVYGNGYPFSMESGVRRANEMAAGRRAIFSGLCVG